MTISQSTSHPSSTTTCIWLRLRATFVIAVLAVAFLGCNRGKSTNDLLSDLSSSNEMDRLKAVRLLQQRQADATNVVPKLIDALKDSSKDVRWSAAIGLGYFGKQAESAIPALEEAQKDKDARIREASRVAISKIKS